jgi:hypothetical protein
VVCYYIDSFYEASAITQDTPFVPDYFKSNIQAINGSPLFVNAIYCDFAKLITVYSTKELRRRHYSHLQLANQLPISLELEQRQQPIVPEQTHVWHSRQPAVGQKNTARLLVKNKLSPGKTTQPKEPPLQKAIPSSDIVMQDTAANLLNKAHDFTKVQTRSSVVHGFRYLRPPALQDEVTRRTITLVRSADATEPMKHEVQ